MKMKRVLAVLVLAAGTVRAQQVAATPPMGWNSWDAYGLTITEPQFRANVEVLKTKLAPFGWNYAVIDEGWFFENPQDRDKPEKLHYALDPYGRYVPVPARFPSAGSGGYVTTASPGMLAATIENTSFTNLGNWVHAQGLKFGIHIVRGIPRASVERNLPIWSADNASKFTAADAADQSDACPWDPTNWGVKDNAAGQAWYDSLLRQYASWGVDLLKVDCIANNPYRLGEIEMIRRAIDKTGRPMVLSLSPGPTNLSHAEEVEKLSNMWRIADDEWDVWDSKDGKFPMGVKNQFQTLADWEKYAGPGHWPDADMLPIGELKPYPGYLDARSSRLTPDETRTELTLWAIARSPLILGANLTLLDDAMLKMLTNKDWIAVNQTAMSSSELKNRDGLIVWRASLPKDRVALAVFNSGDSAMKVDQKLSEFDLGLGAGSVRVRDVWAEKELGKQSGISVTIPAHGCALFLISK